MKDTRPNGTNSRSFGKASFGSEMYVNEESRYATVEGLPYQVRQGICLAEFPTIMYVSGHHLATTGVVCVDQSHAIILGIPYFPQSRER